MPCAWARSYAPGRQALSVRPASTSPTHASEFFRMNTVRFAPRRRCRIPAVKSCAVPPPAVTAPEESRSNRASILETLTTLFPVWVALGSVVAAVFPPAFLWFDSRLIVLALAGIMAGMGLTLSYADFAGALARPRTVALGVAAQYCIMPSLGYAISRLLPMPAEVAVGVVLVSVCPGGAASNLVCLIGGADVALSVVLTLCSTLLSVFAVPFFMQTLAGTLVPIAARPLFVSTTQVVLLPLAAGVLLKVLLPRLVDRAKVALPLLSVVGVTLICGSIVARNAVSALSAVSPWLVLGLCAMHGLGGLLGFFWAKIAGVPENSARTVSIEVMMQNSSLAVALALAHFPSPLTAIPGNSACGSLGTFWLIQKTAMTDSYAMFSNSLISSCVRICALCMCIHLGICAPPPPPPPVFSPWFGHLLSAVSATMHSVMGSILAGLWRWGDEAKKAK